MTRLSEEEKRYLKYQVYSFRYDDPWITNKKIAQSVDRPISTVIRYAEQARSERILSSPGLWPNFHFRNAALLLFEDKWSAFNELREYAGVYYMSVFQGDWDIMIIHDNPIDFSQIPGYKGKILEGVRGRVFTQKVKYTSWEKSFVEIENLLEHKKLEESCCRNSIEYEEWDVEDWKLFEYFRFNVRKKFSDLRKVYPISWRKYGEWKQNLVRYCTMLLFYFPEGRLSYDCLTLSFRTGYERFIVQLFSLLPATSVFYTIDNYLFANIFVPWDSQPQMKVYDIISRLIKQNIVTNYMDGNRIVHWYYDVESCHIY